MKNYRAPRTLSECEFTVGYPRVPRRDRCNDVVVLVSLVIFVAVAVLLAVAL